MSNWGFMFSESLLSLWYGFINFIPSLLGAIILFIVGWIFGRVTGKAIEKVISVIKLDKLFDSAGMEKFRETTGIKLTVGNLIGGIIKWFIIIVFLMASLEIIGLTQVNDFLRTTVVLYLPKVIIAAFILIIAAFLAKALDKIIFASAKMAKLNQANMIGSICRYAVWGFAFIIALSELGIATSFMQIIFTGLIASLAIALGLSFGLGGKEAASRVIEKVGRDMK